MKVIVQNLAIEYEDEGNGPTMLMLHGWQDTLRTFDAIAPVLAHEYRVIRVDLPGFGKSDMPHEAWNLARYVDFVDAFIKKLNLQVRVLAGHSFGGRIIIKGVSEGKLDADKVVLIASAGIATPQTWKSRLLGLCAKIAKPILRVPPFLFFRDRIRRAFYAKIGSDYGTAGTLEKTFIEVINEDLEDAAAKVTMPTLLIYGSADTSAPLAYGRTFAAKMPRAQLETISGAGHFVHQENAADVVGLVHNFLK